MRNLSVDPPTDLQEGAQLVLSVYNCLHLTGEPISIGRLDYVLRKFAKPIDPSAKIIHLDQNDQDIIDSFWIKVGEKANFNKGFFEDHQKWGNIAMGGSFTQFPQGASFNQWGQQLTVGGSNPDNSPFYNSITVHCLRAARTIPMNAPCLGLRILPTSPPAIL
jgi:pyruvate-formate lyase